MAPTELEDIAPLLAALPASEVPASEILRHELLYQRFSPSQKRTIVALISYAAVIPCEYLNVTYDLGVAAPLNCNPLALASGSFIPSIPEISKDLETSGSVIRYGRIHLPCLPSKVTSILMSKP